MAFLALLGFALVIPLAVLAVFVLRRRAGSPAQAPRPVAVTSVGNGGGPALPCGPFAGGGATGSW
jgi:hypothetical protein